MDRTLTDDFDRAVRASYPHWASENVRYSDQDGLGHVNNNAYGAYFETGRLKFFRDSRLREGLRGSQAGVVRRIEMEFLRELTWPNTVEIGTRLTRLGTSSFDYRQALFIGETCFALAHTTSVAFDLSTRQKVALSEEQRDRLLAAGYPP